MAIRPIFIPHYNGNLGAEEKLVDFKWFPGMAKSQKQKSIAELHSAAARLGYQKILEVSSKSEEDLGVRLSAFNLLITTKKNRNVFTVETAFQGSKVFSSGGPFRDLFGMDSLSAKKDIRLKESGPLIKFDFFGISFPLEPRTFFYDWLYINALVQNDDLSKEVVSYDGFSDIEFNPEKSINCQAHAVALYVSLVKEGKLDDALRSSDEFLGLLHCHYEKQRRTIAIQNIIA